MIGARCNPQDGDGPSNLKPGTIVDSFATIRLPAVHKTRGKPASPISLVSPESSDEALISEIHRGDTDALASLFRRYARIVRGVAYRVLCDTSEADDLLQDIFVLVHRLCGTFDSSKGSARFWILQMTYRRAISRRRYLTSRHFYTHIDLDQAANQLGEANAEFGRPETSGVERLITGICTLYKDDEPRLARASAMFDDLHGSFSRRSR